MSSATVAPRWRRVFIVAAVHAGLVGQLGVGMAVAQIVPAGFWLAVRVVFLIRHGERRASSSSS